jgi:hypothetical protein
MSARDKIQKTAPKLCFGPKGVTPEQLSEFADMVDTNFDALLDDLKPLPEPDNFDLEPFNFGDIEEDGPNGGGFIGGGDDGDDGQDGQDGGPGGGPAGCIVPAHALTEITGLAGTTPGLGIATLNPMITGEPSDEAAEFVANTRFEEQELGAPPNAEQVRQEADLERLRKEVFPAVPAIGVAGKNVIAYNISSQAVPKGKNILLGTDEDGRHWVLVESCDVS